MAQLCDLLRRPAGKGEHFSEEGENVYRRCATVFCTFLTHQPQLHFITPFQQQQKNFMYRVKHIFPILRHGTEPLKDSTKYNYQLCLCQFIIIFFLHCRRQLAAELPPCSCVLQPFCECVWLNRQQPCG